MIRKIVLLLIVAFLAYWFTGAYLMKRKVSLFIEKVETDNIKFSHSGMSISGFPISWNVTLDSPKISLIDNLSSTEIAIQDIVIAFSFSLKKTGIDFGSNFNLNQIADEQSTRKYTAIASNNLKLYISTARRIYEIDDHRDAFFEVIKNVSLDEPSISIMDGENEVFSITNLGLAIQKQFDDERDNILFKLKGQYKSDTKHFNFKSASLDTQIKYYSNDSVDDVNKEYDRMIEVLKLYIDFDDAFLDANGAIKLTKVDLPSGLFTVGMRHYERIVDIIVPHDFILSHNYLKKVIAKAIMNSGTSAVRSEQVKFDVKFSDEGVSIGNLDIFEINNKQ